MNPIIRRQRQNSSFHIRAIRQGYTLLACDIDPESFDTLTLQMGVADISGSRNEEITVNVYQSGSVVVSRPTVPPGGTIHTNIDLQNAIHTNPGNISIELLCHRSSYNPGCILYFLEAELSPTENYISGNGNPSSRPHGETGNSTSQGSANAESGSVLDEANEAANDVNELVDTVRDIINLF